MEKDKNKVGREEEEKTEERGKEWNANTLKDGEEAD